MTTGAAREALERALDRIADPTGEGARTFTKVYVDEARATADAADLRARFGRSLGPLDGRLVSIKDLFDVAGEPTAAGGRVYAAGPPARADATVVRRLRRAGAVIVGRTTMTEWAFSGLGLNAWCGTPGNPHDRTRIPGGSSSGAAVAVADGFCAISVGTDTGGSVRVPAAFCGVVGFKPTKARVPCGGAVPLSTTLDSVGPIARSVADCALADAVMADEEPSTPRPLGLEGRRFAVARGRLLDGLDDAVAAAFEAGLARLARAGAVVTTIDLAPSLARLDAIAALGSIPAIEAAAVHADAIRDHRGRIDPRVLARIEAGSRASAPDYVRMLALRSAAADSAQAEIAECDAVALPTVPHVAPPTAPLEADDALWRSVNAKTLRNASVFNMLDCCAVSLPLPDAGPLPVGLMLAAPRHHDRRLLRLAAGVEALFAS